MPGQLYVLCRKIFLASRGPLLGPILQHEDDIDPLRCLFLFANYEDSCRIIEPRLLALNANTADFIQVWIKYYICTLVILFK